ncbi:helix-turn-helix transcriptional regulator [Niveibacterium terrae]|uniref:helix-turn-helix transcriptional regulator n=1 Tax=Niveibacterium terrae TaxID=3373598 RepID=UPI003A8DB74E
MRHDTLTLITADDALARRWHELVSAWTVKRVKSLDQLAPAPGIALIDRDTPDLPELGDATWRSLSSNENLLILASARPDDAEALLAIENGFSGYCHAFASIEQLHQVVSVVASGELWVGRSLVTRLIRAVDRTPAHTSAWATDLTGRESEIARRAANGESNADIANALGISERTVKSHLSSVFEKLKVADRLQLALRVHGIR